MVIRDKKGHYVMTKGSIHLEDIKIINVYTSNIRALKYIKQVLTDLKREVDSNAVMVGGISTPFSAMIRTSKQKVK